MEIALDQCGPASERKISIIDRNRDLFLTSVRIFGMERKSIKIGEWLNQPCLLFTILCLLLWAGLIHILWIVCLCLICKLWASWVYESDSHAMTGLSVSLICILWTIFQQVWSTWWPGTMRQTCWLLLLMARSLCGTIPVLFMLIRTFCQKLCLRKTQGKYLYTVPFNF